jgi:hypothetical protein
MSELIFYNPQHILPQLDKGSSDLTMFSHFYAIYSKRMMLFDRTNTLVSPIRTTNLFPLPSNRPSSDRFEDLCDERATELLRLADELDSNLYVLWSGGIDSTTAAAALLKNANHEQKKRIVFLLSDVSIHENPRFYEDYLRGKVMVKPTELFSRVIGTKNILTSGELGDQVFGSNISSERLMMMYGNEIIHKPYSKDILFEFYNAKFKNEAVTSFYLEIFDSLMSAAPIRIATYFDYFWWLIFTLEWQSVYVRAMQFTHEKNTQRISIEYIRKNIAPFFGTEDFQIWSINNLDKRVRGEWKTFKWPCKDYILDFTKDVEYFEKKGKEASVSIWRYSTNQYNFIDSSAIFHRDMHIEDLYVPSNSFRR